MKRNIRLALAVLATIAVGCQSVAEETAMRKTFDNPKALFPPVAHYSHVVRLDVGDGALLFLSGSVAFDARGNVVGEGDIAKQTEQVFKNISAVLDAHGASMRDVVQTTTYVTDISKLAQVNEVRVRFFPDNPPTSTTVEITALARPELMVEIEAVAATEK